MVFAPVVAFAACPLSKNENGKFTISTYPQLKLVGNSDCPLDGSYLLVADIDASPSHHEDPDSSESISKGFAPLPNGDSLFKGTFDGGGHKIKNLFIYCNGDAALFRRVDEGGKIRNLHMENVQVYSANDSPVYVGGVVALFSGDSISHVSMSGQVGANDVAELGGIVGAAMMFGLDTPTVSACTSFVSITSAGNSYVGGLIGYGSSIRIDSSMSWLTTSISGSNNRVGGLVGMLLGRLSESAADAKISLTEPYQHAGGAVGLILIESELKQIRTIAEIKVGEFGRAGGIAGYFSGGMMLSVQSLVNIEGGAQAHIGGIAGYAGNGSLEKGRTSGILKANGENAYAGGLVGYTGDLSVEKCFANMEASVDSFSYVGTGFGYLGSSTVTNSYGEGSVRAGKKSYAGGLVGMAGSSDISKSYVAASLSTTDVDYVGAVVGLANNSSYAGYWDADLVESIPSGVESGAIELTTLNMKKEESFLDFDFNTVWGIQENTTRPFLRGIGQEILVYVKPKQKKYDGAPISVSGQDIYTIIPMGCDEALLQAQVSFVGSGLNMKNVGSDSYRAVGYSYPSADPEDPCVKLAYIPGRISITPTSIKIKADDQSVVLGHPLPPLTLQAEGLVSTEEESILSSVKFSVAQYTSAGTYDIVPYGFYHPNYSVTYEKGVLTVKEPTVFSLPAQRPNSLGSIRRVSNGFWTAGFYGTVSVYATNGAIIHFQRVNADGFYPVPGMNRLSILISK